MNGDLKTNKRITLIICNFIAVLMIAAAPAAHAGTLKIHNSNCTKWVWKRVTVHVKAGDQDVGCTRTKVSLRKGKSKTIELIPTSTKYEKPAGAVVTVPEYECKYRHEASGTVLGKRDVHGKQHSSVTCKKDWGGVCQCKKD